MFELRPAQLGHGDEVLDVSEASGGDLNLLAQAIHRLDVGVAAFAENAVHNACHVARPPGCSTSESPRPLTVLNSTLATCQGGCRRSAVVKRASIWVFIGARDRRHFRTVVPPTAMLIEKSISTGNGVESERAGSLADRFD